MIKVIIPKETTLDETFEGLSSKVNDKFYYIPGWFEKLENGDFQFHNMNNLPKELIEAVEKIRNPKTPKK